MSLTIMITKLLVNTRWVSDIFYWSSLSITKLRHLVCFKFLIFDIWISCYTSSCQYTFFSRRIHPWLKPCGSLCYICLNTRLNWMGWSYERALLFNQLNLLALSHSLIHILDLWIISVRIIYLLLLVNKLILLLWV